MSEPHPTGSQELLRLLTMGGPWVFQSVRVATELQLADHLGAEPLTAAELAVETGAHPDALHRFCRTLAALGVLAEHPGPAFTLTPAGEALQLDDIRGVVQLWGGDAFRAWADVLHTVRTGEPALRHQTGLSYAEYLAAHPEQNAAFLDTLATGMLPPAAVEWFDFSRSRLVVDVGGRSGIHVAAALQANPAARGVLLDRPAGLRQAPGLLAALGVADRCEIVEGSYFDGVPTGGDTYLLGRVLCDWDDPDALRVLDAVRKAMEPDGRLLVLDPVLPAAGPGRLPGLFADLHMLVVTGGRSRAEDELVELLARGGFEVSRSLRPGGEDSAEPPNVIEAVQAA